jgi:hypothetical protein
MVVKVDFRFEGGKELEAALRELGGQVAGRLARMRRTSKGGSS